METQAEQVIKINALSATLSEIGTETDALIVEVAALKKALENQTDASPELVAAVDAVVAQAKVVANKVPNAEPPPETSVPS